MTTITSRSDDGEEVFHRYDSIKSPFYQSLIGFFYILFILCLFLFICIRETVSGICAINEIKQKISGGDMPFLYQITPFLVVLSLLCLLSWILGLTWESVLLSSFRRDPNMVLIAPATSNYNDNHV